MKARWNGTTLAESDETVEVGGYVYFPPASVRTDLLRKVPKTPHDLECPHGVQFFDVVENGAEAGRAAWSYEAPQPKMAAVDHWFGFWHEVTVED